MATPQNRNNSNKRKMTPSPFSKGVSDKFDPNKKKKKTAPLCRIHHVQPQVNERDQTAGFHGFAITIDGYAERPVTATLYNRTDATSVEFLNNLAPIPRVLRMQNMDGTPMNNSAGYQMRALGFSIPQDMVASVDEASLRTFVETVFIPAVVLLPDVETTPIMDPNPTGYTVYRTWSDIIGVQDIRAVIQTEIITGTAFANPNQWMHDSQENVYSMFPLGGITAEVARTFQLTALHVAAADHGIFGVQPADDNNDNA
jgi:hypothetical protein